LKTNKNIVEQNENKNAAYQILGNSGKAVFILEIRFYARHGGT
jgi:hypothetical protein